MGINDRAKDFVNEVKEWVGNSPWKATAFGLACAFVGYLTSIWPF